MILTKSEQIGVIACPGAEEFAEDIISNLKSIYIKRYTRRLNSIARRYEMEKPEIIKTVNLNKEFSSPRPYSSEDIHKFKPPRYRIPVRFTRFANGEVKSEIQNSIRGMDLYIVSDCENHYPLEVNQGSTEKHVFSVNDHIMMLFATVDAAMGAGANSCVLVLPAYPYARQHQKKGREALTAAWFGRSCEFMGVSRIITLDIHSKAIENSFKLMSLENLHASYQVLRELFQIVDIESEDLVIVSPDTGAVDRNKFYATSLEKPLALLYKERDYSKVSKSASDNNITSIKLLGDVKGKTVFMADDMLGTGGTLIIAMRTLKALGAKKIICTVSLPLFSGNAVESFEAAYKEGLFDYIIGTDAVFHEGDLYKKAWFVKARISGLFAETISRLHHGISLSSLLDNRKIIKKLLSREKSSDNSSESVDKQYIDDSEETI
ncbi:MAG: ribose-phosphate diphosphokinase [Spirochaetales bacterium]|nr:ribose-phosphate diphosphokinase [Spirochaetales bacterium]